jgi:hypothetical protein
MVLLHRGAPARKLESGTTDAGATSAAVCVVRLPGQRQDPSPQRHRPGRVGLGHPIHRAACQRLHKFSVPPGLETRNFVSQIAFPQVNIGPQIPMLLTMVVGNISMGGRIKVLDIRFPKMLMEGFQDPKLGITGVREVPGVPDRPPLNNMIKPCTSYTPEGGGAVPRGGHGRLRHHQGRRKGISLQDGRGLEEKSRLDFLRFPGILPALCTPLN